MVRRHSGYKKLDIIDQDKDSEKLETILFSERIYLIDKYQKTYEVIYNFFTATIHNDIYGFKSTHYKFLEWRSTQKYL